MNPYRVLGAAKLGPLVLLCEHASNRLPGARPRNAAERAVLNSHWGWDIGGWELSRHLAASLDATAVGGRWSRLWIDLNRRIDDPTLVRRVAAGLELSWNRRVGVREVERRVLEIHDPYHRAVDRQVARRLVRGVRPLVFAVHSFTPNYDGEVRRFDIGVLFERESALAKRLGRSLRESGYVVRYNAPYSGMAGMMYAADRHGRHFGLPCLELEVNQEIFSRPASARRLKCAVADAVAGLI